MTEICPTVSNSGSLALETQFHLQEVLFCQQKTCLDVFSLKGYHFQQFTSEKLLHSNLSGNNFYCALIKVLTFFVLFGFDGNCYLCSHVDVCVHTFVCVCMSVCVSLCMCVHMRI